MEFLSWLGFVLTVLGTVLTGLALWADHRDYGSRPLIPWWPRFVAWLRRAVLRKQQSVNVHAVTAEATIRFNTEAHAFVILREDAPVDEQIT